jgi:DNA-binding CsgD family transcriptional regulator
LEVLRAVRSALSNVEIGEKLGISALTVKNHLRKIMRKLGARSRVQAVAEAMSRQLIV